MMRGLERKIDVVGNTKSKNNLHIGGKHIKSLVKVVHLHNDADANKDSKDIC